MFNSKSKLIMGVVVVILLLIIGVLFVGNSRMNFDNISGFNYSSGSGSVNISVAGVRDNNKFSVV